LSSIQQIANINSIVTEDTLSQGDGSYVTFCQVCDWYGYPFKKIIREFEGFRCEEEDGFAYKFTEYDYDIKTGEKGNKHIHKYDPKLVKEDVDFALKIRNDRSDQK